MEAKPFGGEAIWRRSHRRRSPHAEEYRDRYTEKTGLKVSTLRLTEASRGSSYRSYMDVWAGRFTWKV